MMDRRLKLISALALVALPLSLQAATGVVSTQTANQQKLQDIINSLRYGRGTGAPIIGPIGGLNQAPVIATAPTAPAPFGGRRRAGQVRSGICVFGADRSGRACASTPQFTRLRLRPRRRWRSRRPRR